MKSVFAKLSRSGDPPTTIAGPALVWRLRWPAVLSVVLFGACLFWAYWPTFAVMWDRWATNPQYSHGFLVPVFALVVLWSRRERRPRVMAPPSWWGLGLLAVALLLRFVGAFFYYQTLDGLSLLPLLAGMCLLLGGAPTLRWAWPAIAFLAFMVPLPFQLDTALSRPLQGLATTASTYALQTLGYPAIAEGNIIVIDELQLNVIDACSGLGMLFTFFALATAVALIINRPALDRWLVVASAIPIALLVNVIRITLTGVAHLTLGPEVGHMLMHELAGWLMMPLALGFVWLELWFLGHLLIPRAPSAPIPVSLVGEERTSGEVPSRSRPHRQTAGASRVTPG